MEQWQSAAQAVLWCNVRILQRLLPRLSRGHQSVVRLDAAGDIAYGDQLAACQHHAAHAAVGTRQPRAGQAHRPIARLDRGREHADGPGQELQVLL